MCKGILPLFDVETNANAATDAEREVRIKALSDEMLSHYYALLSDTRVLIESSALKLIESELHLRGLPMSMKH